MHFREFLNNFAPYEWEPSNEQIASKYNISPDDIIRLDTNTSPYSPNKWLQKLTSILEGLPVQQYPDASYSKVRKLISDYTEFSMDPKKTPVPINKIPDNIPNNVAKSIFFYRRYVCSNIFHISFSYSLVYLKQKVYIIKG